MISFRLGLTFENLRSHCEQDYYVVYVRMSGVVTLSCWPDDSSDRSGICRGLFKGQIWVTRADIKVCTSVVLSLQYYVSRSQSSVADTTGI